MDTPGDPPPEGRLIEDARERRRLSQNKAAELAGISGTRWRQIVTGTASGGKGIQVPVHGRAETVARMAQVVGVTAEQLSSVDREDAGRELRRLPPLNGAGAEPSLGEVMERMTALAEEVRKLQRRDEEREREHAEEIERLRRQQSG